MRIIAVFSLALGVSLAGCGDEADAEQLTGNGSNGSNGGNGTGGFDVAACQATCDKTLGECGGGLIPQPVIDECKDACDSLPVGGVTSECVSAANSFYVCVASTPCEELGACEAEANAADAACGT